MMKTLSWTEFNILGMLGFGATVPTNGTVCLIARDTGGKRIVGVARFVRKGLAAYFERQDGTRYNLWDVSGWMDAKPLADFLKNPAATLYA